jgi:hypothetical protein
MIPVKMLMRMVVDIFKRKSRRPSGTGDVRGVSARRCPSIAKQL